MLTFNNNDFTQLNDHRYTLRDVTEALGYDWGMDDYPIFDESYRQRLNRAIWNHFALRRIASDTPSNFIFYLNRRMHEQMPNINPVYELVRRENFDPFATTQGQSKTNTEADTNTASQTDTTATNKEDTSFTTKSDASMTNHEGTSSTSLTDGSGTTHNTASSESSSSTDTESESNANSTTRATTSATPQVFLDNPDGEQYLTGVNKQTSESSESSSGTTTSKDTGSNTADGKTTNTEKATASGTTDGNGSSTETITGSTNATGNNSSGETMTGQTNTDGKSETVYSAINGGVGNTVNEALAAGFLATDNIVFEMLEPLFMQFWDDQPM